MDFRILGSLEVVQAGRVAELGGPRQRLLLARLAVAANRVVSVDRLVEDLWGARARPGTKEALQAQISRARKALGENERVRSHAAGYVLRLEPEELDASRFEASVACARVAVASGDLAARCCGHH